MKPGATARPAGVDRLPGGLVHLAERDHAPVADADVARAAPGAPLPSTIVPPRMSRSSMGRPPGRKAGSVLQKGTDLGLQRRSPPGGLAPEATPSEDRS